VDDFPNLGFKPGKCVLPKQNDSQAFFLLRGRTAGEIAYPLGSPIPLTQVYSPSVLSRTKKYSPTGGTKKPSGWLEDENIFTK